MDDDVYNEVKNLVWTTTPDGYVIHWTGRYSWEFLHRRIMKTPKGLDTDHIDADKLNNQRLNLRVCTHRENLQNGRKHFDGRSIFRGVSPHKRGWRVQIRGQTLGYFPDEFSAAMCYDIAARDVFGGYARLNSPDGIHR